MKRPSLKKLFKLTELISITNQGTGLKSPWKLYEFQKLVLEKLNTEQKTIWLKARQLGISTLSVYYMFVIGINNPNFEIGIVADTFDKSTGLLDKIRDFASQLGLSASTSNQTKLTLSNGTTFTAITVNSSISGESKAGRSKTFHALLLSEAAYYSNSEAVFQSIIASLIPDGIVIVESTATPGQNIFRKLYDSNTYAKGFISFEQNENYQADPSLISDEKFQELKNKYNLQSRSHAAFWNNKLNSEFGGNVNRLLREYPVNEEHSWSFASGRFIEIDPKVKPYISNINSLSIFEEYAHGHVYIAGIDVAAGVGRDSSVITVYNLNTKSISAIFKDNTAKLPEVAHIARTLQDRYLIQSFYVETNGIGAGLISQLQANDIKYIEHQSTESSKYEGLLRVKIGVEQKGLCADEAFKIDCGNLVYELRGNKEVFNHPPDTLMSLSFCLLNEDKYEYMLLMPAPRKTVGSNQFDIQKILNRESRLRRR